MASQQHESAPLLSPLLAILALAPACSKSVEPPLNPSPPLDEAPANLAPTPRVDPSRGLPPPPAEVGADDAIVIAGQRFSIGSRVVLWDEPDGYSAYSTEPHFGGEPRADAPEGLRYLPGRKRDDVEFPEPTLEELQDVLDQFVLHFDVCGVSRQCFKVLQDLRGLSVHFMLDLDGTLYQTLDLRDTAWHARQANARSIGIEIANMGGYAPGEPSILDDWYARDEIGWRVQLPERLGDGGVRTPEFVARPARAERVQGSIQGETFEQFDFTPQQYDTLVKLASVLCRVLPKIEPDAPRDAHGRVRTDVLSPAEFDDFRGILGHLHVTREKYDPGPALDWEGFLARVRERL